MKRGWAAWVGRGIAAATGIALAFLLGWAGEGLRAGAASASVFVPLPAGFGGAPEDATGWAAAGELVVRFRPEVARRRGAVIGAGEGAVRWLVPRGGRALAGPAEGWAAAEMAVVTLPPGADLMASLAEWGRRPDVVYAEPNLRLRLCVEGGGEARPAPSDFEFARQWALQNTGQTGGRAGADIGALRAWSVTTGARGVVAAIIDTGIDYYHPDLEPNIWRNPGEVPGNGVDDDGNGYVDDVHGFDFVTDDGDPMDDNIHGTHVAGILGAAGDDENGIAGVAWSVQLMAVKAFDESGSGTLDDTIAAITYAAAAGARVINASWGTTIRSRALEEVVIDAVHRGVVFVAAAGNNGSDAGFYPAAAAEAIAVGATDANDAATSFSNYGSFVDLVAPGDSIHSTAPNAFWTQLSGTSMAAPHVSGAAVLLLSRRPSFTPSEIGAILRSTAAELATDRFTGAGRLDAGRAVLVGEPLPTAVLSVPSELSGRVDVVGTAGGNGFAGFRLELGEGSRPSRWDVLGAGAVPTEGGVLLPGFDTARYDDGPYSLRLLVSNQVGQVAVERAQVTIRNVRMTHPLNNDVLRAGDRVEIRGTVFGAGRTLAVSWGLGKEPVEWRTNGVVLPRGASAPIVDGVLAEWDTSVVPDRAFVTVRLEAFREGTRVGEARARMVHLESRLRAGWPVTLEYEEDVPRGGWREFNVADLEGDGTREIILVDHGEPGGRPPALTVIDADGRVRWRRDLPAGDPESDAPVVGDVDGDGRAEIFVDTGDGGVISAFDAAGQPLGGGWPVAPGGTHFGKILADVDADGRLELVVLSNPPTDLVGIRERVLAVLGADGSVRSRWRLGACEEEAVVPEQVPAVANLDEDDGLEIVVVDGCFGLAAYDPGRPEAVLWATRTEANLFGSPVVADLDGDGTEEVIIGGASREKGLPGGLYVFEANGQMRRGWPVLTETSFPAGLALGDLDMDGRLEIVAPDWDGQVVHAVGPNGFEPQGWPLPLQVNAGTRSVPVIGDVDGDGWPDVVLASPGTWLQVQLTGDTTKAGGIRAWRGDGGPIDLQPGQPPDGLVMESVSGANWRLPPAVLTDLDGDGLLDVVAATLQDRAYAPTQPLATPKRRSSLYAWELPVPFHAADAVWPAFQGGATRAGRLFRPPPPNRPPLLRAIPDQTIATGARFREVSLDRYAEDPDGRREDLVWRVRGAIELAVGIDGERVARVTPPTPGWEGTEVIEFVAADPAGAEATQSVRFEVRAGYVPPVARPDRMVLDEDTSLELDAVANDTSPEGRALRVVGLSAPSAGETELLPDGRIRYLPAPDFFGSDAFEYSVADGAGGLATGEVTVQVNPVPDAPLAGADQVILDEDTAVELSLLANDMDPDGEELALLEVEPPAEGRLEALGDGRFWFVPPPDYSGLQELGYRVADPGGLTATGRVAILVKPVNDAPRLRDQVVALNRNRATDIFYDVFDADGDVLTFTVIDGPTNGVLLAYPSIANYEPRRGFTGTDRFTYTASDGRVLAGPATVTLQVGDANNPPEVEPLNTVTAENQELPIGLRVRDVDLDPVTLEVVEAPRHGEVSLEGTKAVYRPAAGFLGTDSFAYRASDGRASSMAATVTIRVTDENTAPRAESEVLTVARNQASTVRLRAVDAENNPLRFLVVTNPVYGVLAGEAPELSYTPRPNFRGLDRLNFTVSDGRLTSETAVVHLLVRDPNQTPRTTNQTVELGRDEPVGFRLAATDADGHALRAAVLKGPRWGRLYGTGLDYTFVPQPGFEGQDRFTYKVWDGFAYSAEATVTLVISRAPPRSVEIVGTRWTGEGLRLTVRGPPGWALRIESSADLVQWESRGAVSNPTGSLTWTDGASVGEAFRFYRAVLEGVGDAP